MLLVYRDPVREVIMFYRQGNVLDSVEPMRAGQW